LRRREKREEHPLTEVESKQILKEAGINSTGIRLAQTRDEAISLSNEIGFPVVLKIVSPDVLHKTDAGGVKLGLGDEEAVGKPSMRSPPPI